MKLIFVILIVIVSYIESFAQISPEDLDNPLNSVRLYALKVIINENLVEFIPEIQQRLFEQPTLTMQFAFLDALTKLEDPEIEQWTLEFIENAENFQYPEDPLFYKVQATEILFGINNYSTFQFVFDLLNREPNSVDPVCIRLLNEIILNVPEHKQEATTELVRIFNNQNIDNNIRYLALTILYETNYIDILNLATNAVLGDVNPEIRFYANGILKESNYFDLHNLYVQQLSVEPEAYIRSTYATSLLILFGEPSDLKLAIDYLPGETDELSKEFVSVSIEEFIPPKPENLDYYGLCTRLITYTDEMFVYNWIHNEETKDYYAQRLKEVYESIENSGEIGYACAVIDERILQQLEQDLSGELITIEGYKFLHYYTIYIKEEIEEEYGPCP